ncbi:hypothetical protein ACVDG3_18115 [Meridianimarinicoccus sp. RP-17]|uniref:hypothetical protein n=1 Tax=Meridianimarinicoccus zhengii TaxID=2056810 RepID=UPI000DAF1466|nr:hypothetical protein [Phycocomes zhengii]
MTARPPIRDSIPRLRQRQRRDGSWRIWWEPETRIRPLGFTPVELDEKRLTWSAKRARGLNTDVAEARKRGRRTPVTRATRTVAALIADYRASRQYLDRAAATRRTYDSLMNRIDDRWGPHPVAVLTKVDMDRWYDDLLGANSVRNAEAIIRMASTLFAHAERRGWRPENSNPCARLGLRAPTARDRVLSWAETDHLVATAERMGLHAVSLAIDIAQLQGQRQTDILLLTPDQITPRTVADPVTGQPMTRWVLELRRSKRGTVGAMAVHLDLQPRLGAHLKRLPADAPRLLLDDRTGQPYARLARNGDGWDMTLFNKRFAAVRTAAGAAMPSLGDVQFRDLRRTFGQRARLGGASRDDAGDVLGNSAARDFALGQVYMGAQFWTATRAIDAVQRPVKPEEKKG